MVRWSSGPPEDSGDMGLSNSRCVPPNKGGILIHICLSFRTFEQDKCFKVKVLMTILKSRLHRQTLKGVFLSTRWVLLRHLQQLVCERQSLLKNSYVQYKNTYQEEHSFAITSSKPFIPSIEPPEEQPRMGVVLDQEDSQKTLHNKEPPEQERPRSKQDSSRQTGCFER
eukprot:985106-Amphidinium_carterae.1